MSLLSRVETISKNEINSKNVDQLQKAKEGLNTYLNSKVDNDGYNQTLQKEASITSLIQDSYIRDPYAMFRNASQLWPNDKLTLIEKMNARARFSLFAPVFIIVIAFVYVATTTNLAGNDFFTNLLRTLRDFDGVFQNKITVIKLLLFVTVPFISVYLYDEKRLKAEMQSIKDKKNKMTASFKKSKDQMKREFDESQYANIIYNGDTPMYEGAKKTPIRVENNTLATHVGSPL